MARFTLNISGTCCIGQDVMANLVPSRLNTNAKLVRNKQLWQQNDIFDTMS